MSNACWKVSEVYEGATFRRVCASFILCCFSFCRFLQSQKKPFMLCCTLNAFSLKYKMERVIGTEDDIFFTVKTVEWNEDTEPFAKIKSHLNLNLNLNDVCRDCSYRIWLILSLHYWTDSEIHIIVNPEVSLFTWDMLHSTSDHD